MPKLPIRVRLAALSFTLLAAACGSDPLEPGAGNDTGTGTGTLEIDGDANATPRVANTGDKSLFDTSFSLRILRAGAQVTTGTVTVESQGGSVTLTHDPSRDGGTRLGSQSGYYEVYAFNVESGSDNVKGAYIDGPDIRTITAPTGGATV